MNSRPPHLVSNRGFALVAVLWLLVLLTVMASSLSYSSRNSARDLTSQREATEARYLAEGAIQLVYLNLLKPKSNQRLLADGETVELELGDGEVEVTLVDEHGKIDINAASEFLLTKLFISIDLPDDESAALAAAIADYRDNDELRRLNGAELEDYQKAGLLQEPKNDRFTTLDELTQVLGMTTETFQTIKPLITVYTNHRGINPEVASLGVLMAASSESAATLQYYIDDRRHSHQAGLPLPPPPVIDRQFLSRVKGAIYSISAVGVSDSGRKNGLTAVVRLRRGRDRATIETLEWKPFLPAANNSVSVTNNHSD